MATMADLNNIARPAAGAAVGGLPGIPPGMDKEAEKMWNELTRMAKEDPDKYDEFIAGQMKDAKKAAKKQEREKPKPAICVESWGKQKASSASTNNGDGEGVPITPHHTKKHNITSSKRQQISVYQDDTLCKEPVCHVSFVCRRHACGRWVIGL